MIVLLKPEDLRSGVVSCNQLSLHHTRLCEDTMQTAELIAYTNGEKVIVLKSTKMRLGQISAAELLKYIAEHAFERAK